MNEYYLVIINKIYFTRDFKSTFRYPNLLKPPTVPLLYPSSLSQQTLAMTSLRVSSNLIPKKPRYSSSQPPYSLMGKKGLNSL